MNWLVFITEMKSVYSAVRTGALWYGKKNRTNVHEVFCLTHNSCFYVSVNDPWFILVSLLFVCFLLSLVSALWLPMWMLRQHVCTKVWIDHFRWTANAANHDAKRVSPMLNLKLKLKLKFTCGGLFGTSACRPIVPLPPMSSSHSSPEAPRTT